MTILFCLLVANALAHLISFFLLKATNQPNRFGVLVFFVINLILAILIWQNTIWAKWLALLFPLIGGLSLLLTVILKQKGKWIDYLILLLDIVIVYLIIRNYLI